MIRTIKSSLHKVIGRKKLKYFEIVTLLSDIQNAINSRPLTYSGDDLNVISPNSFLKLDSGRSLLFGSEARDLGPLSNRRTLLHGLERREELFQQLKDLWYEEYLISLRESGRDLYQDDWSNKISINDIVLIYSPIKPRPLWQIGRVSELILGSDNKTRSVKVVRPDHSEGVYSINLLYPLELSISPVITDEENEKETPAEERRPRRIAAARCLRQLKHCT